MRIFIVGGTGVMGRRLVPLLVAAGHTVLATTRRADRMAPIVAAGAQPVKLDVLDAADVHAAVRAAAPDVVIHQATAIGQYRLKYLDHDFARTNQLRTRGTTSLVAAASAAGVSRFIAQSFTGWTNPRTGGPVKDEDDPLDPWPPAAMQETVRAIGTHEDLVTTCTGMAGIVLRYGVLYGVGTAMAPGGEYHAMIRKRRFPIVGAGTGIWSFVHVDDAASATVAAVVRGESGIYNVVDDEPAPVITWLPELARTIGAPSPRRVPVWLARWAIGDAGIAIMTEARGSSNARAQTLLGWHLDHPTWRSGFRAMQGAT